MKIKIYIFVFLILLKTLFIYSDDIKEVPVYTYEIVNVYSHDTNSFTQGLCCEDGFLYESIGLRGRSALMKIELETGKVLQKHEMQPAYFAEGITIYGDKIIQLTWKSGKGFVYNKEDFDLLNDFDYKIQGWGITTDGKKLIMSDGSSVLYFLNPDNYKEIGKIEVCDNNGPVSRLNELEYVNGSIYANVWKTDLIAIINPDDGNVIGWIDLTGILSSENSSGKESVLNGIAYDSESNRLFVTGKYWPRLFEIKLVLKNG